MQLFNFCKRYLHILTKLAKKRAFKFKGLEGGHKFFSIVERNIIRIFLMPNVTLIIFVYQIE